MIYTKRQALEALRDVVDRIYISRGVISAEAAMTLTNFEKELDEIEKAVANDIDEYMARRYHEYNNVSTKQRQV